MYEYKQTKSPASLVYDLANVNAKEGYEVLAVWPTHDAYYVWVLLRKPIEQDLQEITE